MGGWASNLSPEPKLPAHRNMSSRFRAYESFINRFDTSPNIRSNLVTYGEGNTRGGFKPKHCFAEVNPCCQQWNKEVCGPENRFHKTVGIVLRAVMRDLQNRRCNHRACDKTWWRHATGRHYLSTLGEPCIQRFKTWEPSKCLWNGFVPPSTKTVVFLASAWTRNSWIRVLVLTLERFREVYLCINTQLC